MSLKNFLRLITAIVVCELAGVSGTLFTVPAVSTWYATLSKPALNPPAWVFGPVWTILYLLMGMAAFLVWKKMSETKMLTAKNGEAAGSDKTAIIAKRKLIVIALLIFLIQLLLNVRWPIIFFGLHNPGAAFFELIILWLAILATIILFAKISRPAAWMLVPYILWVSFAGYLNYSVWILNPASNSNLMACTTEAKICPDGSAVGRTGVNCEFAPCPSINNQTQLNLNQSSTTPLNGLSTSTNPMTDNLSTKAAISGNYLGSYDTGNYVWGGAMNLAWNDLNSNILHEKLALNTDDSTVLSMVAKLNDPVFTKNDLDAASYYIKSGYGQGIVDEINKESRAKFPSKTFSDLQMSLRPTDIISYAYFLKQVEYVTAFNKEDVSFLGQSVKGFFANKGDQRAEVKIIKYVSDDKFIVSLQLKEASDQLILAKGYDLSDPAAMVKEIDKDNQGTLASLGPDDNFAAPILHLDYNRNYSEIIGKALANKNFTNYIIAAMYENIKFNMDEKGARVENEAVIGLMGAVFEPHIKNFILDKPYWIVMKRQNSGNPYFILGVNNTALMTKN